MFFCREGEDIDAGTETNSNLYHELYYHFLGTDQSQDILCWRDHENPKYMFGAEVTDDGKVTLGSFNFDYALNPQFFFSVNTVGKSF